jgi:hypothetical protein
LQAKRKVAQACLAAIHPDPVLPSVGT